jgi:hypothetical protein
MVRASLLESAYGSLFAPGRIARTFPRPLRQGGRENFPLASNACRSNRKVTKMVNCFTTLWYLEFRRALFTPYQALKIARRITTYSPAELRGIIGAENYAYMVRTARP